MIRVATFNVHGFVGRDRRRDLVRTAAVISELECTAVGLQEVDSRTDDATIAALERRTGMRAMSGVTMASPVGDYGNLMLTTGRASEVRRHDLTVPGREPRGALEAKIEIAHESSLRMIVTHLGLRRSERRRQTMDLLRIVARLPAEREVVLAGDFNEWWPAAATC